MPYLIRDLKEDNLNDAEQLKQAYTALAACYLEHRRGGLRDVAEKSTLPYDEVRRKVGMSEEWIDLKKARQQSDLIGAERERPVEIFNNLGQVEVLISAIEIMQENGYNSTCCAPTQQSTNEEGISIPDLCGVNWALEAFGGTKYQNNKKLAKDLASLYMWNRVYNEIFLAFRISALSLKKQKMLEANNSVEVSGTWLKGGNGTEKPKTKYTATLKLIGSKDSKCVCQVCDLELS